MQHVILLDELPEWQAQLQPEAVHIIQEAQIEGFSHFSNFALFSFDWYDIHSDVEELFRILIYMNDDTSFYICKDESAWQYCSRTLAEIEKEQPTLSNEQILYHFFIHLFHGDLGYLEKIEDQLDTLMADILSGDLTNTLDAIVAKRRELVRLKRYYEKINIVFNDMLLDDSAFFSHNILDRLAILDARTDRYASKVQNLQDIVDQMQDAYQAQLSIQQNDLMKFFTIITTIFLPLTLLVGWYGMNFTDMPELHWRYGYPAVIAVSVLIVVGLFWYFKHKKWL